ncbi:Fe-S protein assembly co-chaperone HscB [Psychrobacter sp. DM8]|uniref:Fe-S protein assembly co-chaperone HscB n=1 Tax=unclassified Psychrobacter TaxID=196806 RepID=UPI003F509D5F
MTDSTKETSIKISEEVRFDTFFALFEQPVTFNIAQEDLDQRLRVLQKRYHPDNADKDNASDAKRHSERTSALINQAYQTLSMADSRASYLLDIQGQAITLEQSIADLDFLDDAMDLRINLDDAIESNNQAALQQMHPQITQRIAVQSERFSGAYEQQNWEQAIDATQKLKFLVKLEADVKSGLDAVASSAQSDDDDLYV